MQTGTSNLALAGTEITQTVITVTQYNVEQVHCTVMLLFNYFTLHSYTSFYKGLVLI